jgi:PAS domain S-box-containing protein
MFDLFKRDTLLWLTAAVAVGLTAIAGSYNVQKMRDTEQDVRTGHETVSEVHGLLSEMKDAETGHRGYLLTGRADFMGPYSTSEPRVRERLAALQVRWAGDPAQGERLARMSQLVTDKFAEMRRTRALRDDGGLEAAAAAVAKGEGKRIMDELRGVCADAELVEQDQLQHFGAAANQQYQTAEGTNLIGALLAVVVIGVSGVLLRRDVWRREQVAAALAVEKQATDRALAQLDALVRNAPYSIAFLDHDLRPVRVNGTFARANRVAVEDHFGRRLPDLVPGMPSDLLAKYHEVLAGGPPVVGRLVVGDGRVWEVSAFRVPLDDEHGGLGVIGQDVTDRQAAAERLRESERRFRQMAEVMPQIVWVARADGYREYYNSRWTEFTGTSEADTLGHGRWADALHPDDRQRGLDAWARAVATGEPYQIEYRFRRSDGAYEWFLGRALPVRDEAGRVIRWLGTCTNIDEQVRTAQALVEKEAYIRGVLDNSPDCIKVLDPDGRLIEFNTPGLAVMEIDDFTCLRGRTWNDLWPAETQERVRQAVVTAAAGRVDRFNGWCPTAKGSLKYWDVMVAPIPDASGRVVRLVGVSRDVTDLKRKEDDLREARRFSESVLHSLPSHLAVIEANGHILSVNESWRQFGVANGHPPDFDWTTGNYFDACREEEYGERAEAGIRAVAKGERGALEMEYPCHGYGVERYFLLRANRFRGDGPVRLVVTHENITERVVAERQVREGASQLAQLTEGVPLLMWACRPTGECDYLSRQWLDYTGRGLVEQLGYGWMEAVHPDDREPTAAAWRTALEAGGGYEVEFRLRRHDGAFRWFAVRGIPLRDQAGTVTRWFGSCTDVDDRVQQEERLGRLVEERTLALQEQKIFLNAILDNVAEGIVACDADGKLQLFNAATRRIHGLPFEPLAPDRWVDHYQLFEADGVTPMPTDHVPLVRAWRGEQVDDVELVVRANGQPERYLRCYGQQLRGHDGRVFGAVVSMRDMTEQREYERELVRTADALRVSNQELEKFAYIASHDLQEPLRKIQAFGTRLADKFREAVGEQGKDYIDRMLDSAGRMRQLIEDLLAFSRVTTKGGAFVTVDLNAVARDVLSDLEERVSRSGGRVHVGPLPTVPGDLSQLRQVFQNLIGNALKFAKPDEPPVVRVTAVPFDQLPADAPSRPSGAGWRITVADNGIGFDPQYANRIFELFQRLHGRGEYEGTGLGLAIVRKIVLRHGATITARSQTGRGAEFVIDWPTPETGDPVPPNFSGGD